MGVARPAGRRPCRGVGGARRRPGGPEPEPEADRHARPVVTDRRSAELDRMLEEWERSRAARALPRREVCYSAWLT